MMNVSEYRITMTHDGGTVKIVVTASSAAAAVDSVVKAEGAPRRSARLVETRPLQFEREGNDTWSPVPGTQWGRVDDHPVNVPVHTNPFAPDPENPYATWSSQELDTAHRAWKVTGNTHPVAEELSRRGDVDLAVELWERLCAVPFVRGETQGEYTHSTRHLTPGLMDRLRGVDRMPNREEIEALVLADGEETAYPPHDVDLLAMGGGAMPTHVDTNPWSYGDRLYPVTLTLISCGDYHGSDVDAANNRELKNTPGVDVREPNSGGMGSVFNVSTTVVGEMSSFENATNEGDTDREPVARRADALMHLESLVEQMEGLVEYPLLDEEAHSELIDELAEEAWSSYLEDDVFTTLESRSVTDAQEDIVTAARAEEESTPRVHDAYFAFEENEWSAQSATSVVNGRHDDAVKHVGRTVFGWDW